MCRIFLFKIYIMVNCVARVHSYVERVLDRISNGQLAEDRRTAMVELQSVVAESRAAQLAFGALGMCFACHLTSIIWIIWNFWIKKYLTCFCRISCAHECSEGGTRWCWNGYRSLSVLCFLYIEELNLALGLIVMLSFWIKVYVITCFKMFWSNLKIILPGNAIRWKLSCYHWTLLV